MNARISSRSGSVWLVLCAGLASSLLALVGVFLVGLTTNWHLMGWHIYFVMPAGAILVGVVAASGYGIASWWTGVRITRGLLGVVVVLQLLVYAAAQQIQYQQLQPVQADGSAASFWQYFDWMARSLSWKQRDGSIGTPMGGWGYLFIGLQVVGFCGGSLIVPILLASTRYCEGCQLYMRSQQLVLIPISVHCSSRDLETAENRAEWSKADDVAESSGRACLERLWSLAAANDAVGLRKAILEINATAKNTRALPRYLTLEITYCRACAAGWLHSHQYTTKRNDQTEVIECARMPLAPSMTGQLLPQTEVAVRC